MPLGQQQRRVARRQLEHVPDFLTGEINAVYAVGELPSEPYPHAGTASNDNAITINAWMGHFVRVRLNK